MKRISYIVLIVISFSTALFSHAEQSMISVDNQTMFTNTRALILKAKTELYQKNTEAISLQENSYLIPLEHSKDSEGNNWIRVGIEYSQLTTDTTADYWIPEASLSDPSLVLIDDFILRMTYCYKYVKLYLLKHGLVSSYLPGGSAYMAAKILPKYGFYQVDRSPYEAIVHDVCVYKGGPSGNGHIEVMTSSGWYYGYGYFSHPIKNRILIGCFHK